MASNESTRYAVKIHGTVHGLAIGDQWSVMINEPVRKLPPFMAPPLPPQGVFGRDELLTRIYDMLALGDEHATNVAPVVLQGIEGSGKTTLATALGRLESISRIFPDGILWASLGPNPMIRILLDGWGRALGVDFLPERDEIACRDRLQSILLHRRVLLIVDSVWETTHASYFQIAGPRCRILFTTHKKSVAFEVATRERTLPVDMLSLEMSLALLCKLAPEAVAVDEQAAKRLCEKLEFSPLALTLAGLLLANEADIPTRMQRLVSELIDRCEARLKLLQSEGRLGLSEDQPLSLEAILGMSVERLSKTDQERFTMLAVFAGEPLTWDINAAAYVWA
jgi:hypothetical protein